MVFVNLVTYIGLRSASGVVKHMLVVCTLCICVHACVRVCVRACVCVTVYTVIVSLSIFAYAL